MKGDSFVLLKQTSLSLSVFLEENILRRMEKILGLCCKRQYRTGQIKSVPHTDLTGIYVYGILNTLTS